MITKKTIDRVAFYTQYKKSFGRFTTRQFNGFEDVFNAWEASDLSDIRWLAYMLATAYHETAATMQPIEEYGKGRGKRYGLMIKHSGVAYKNPKKIYFGRGYVQLTWFENYEIMGRLLGFDLLNNPELALNAKIAAKIMFEGMTKGASSFGDFTGKCLEMYFNAKTEDPIGARRIINGTDKAEKIAGHYHAFKKCLV